MNTTPKLLLASLMLMTSQAFAQTTATTDPVGFTTVKSPHTPEATQQAPTVTRDAGTTPNSPTGGNTVKGTHDTTAAKPAARSRPTTKPTKPAAKK
jgi:hypothetical protein